MDEIAFVFDDSPKRVNAADLIPGLSLQDEDEEIAMAELPDGKRLLKFRKAGHGDGLKDLGKVIRDNELSVKVVGNWLVESYKLSQIYKASDLRLLAATDVLESALLRLNYFLQDPDLWTRLEADNVTTGPFESGKDGISYAGLCFYYRDLSDGDPSFVYLEEHISVAMQHAEGEYLKEHGVGESMITSDEFRNELWDYIMTKKNASGRNTVAHIFSNAMHQVKSSQQVRSLTSTPRTNMTEKERGELISTLDDLEQALPVVYKEQRNVVSMQMAFLRSQFENFSPHPIRKPPKMPKS